MSNLNETTLGECVELVIDHRGKTPAKLGGDWTDSGVRVISAANVHNGRIDNEDQIRCVSEEIYNKWMSDDICRNDCFIASEGASLGENCIWDSDEKIVLGQRLYAIRTNPDMLDPWYFAAYMQTKKFRTQIDQISTGSTVFGVSQPVLLGVKLLLPSIEEQRKIGRFYKNIKREIENNNAICEELEHLAEDKFNYWFLQFDYNNGKGKPYRSSGGKMVWNEGIKREIPVGWKAEPFGNIIEFVKGRIPIELFDKQKEGMDPYLTIDVVNLGRPQFCSKENMNYCNGEVVMVMDGAASGDVYVGNKGVLGSTFAILMPKRRDISNSLIYYMLKSQEVAIKKANTGSTVPHANRNFIEKMLIPVCDNMEAFSEELDTIVDKITQCREVSRELITIRDFIMPMLMNRQITIK